MTLQVLHHCLTRHTNADDNFFIMSQITGFSHLVDLLHLSLSILDVHTCSSITCVSVEANAVSNVAAQKQFNNI